MTYKTRTRKDIKHRLTKELLRQLFDYNQETGEFVRIGKVKTNRVTQESEVVPYNFKGTAKSIHGYKQYRVLDVTFDCHTLIYIWMTGEYPLEIDHIDGDRTNNRWSNLRHTTRAMNLRNRGGKARSNTGHVGVCKCKKTGEYRVYIGSNYNAGYYEDLEDAIAARKELEKELGYTERHFNSEPHKHEKKEQN